MSSTTIRRAVIVALLLALVGCVASVGNRNAPKQEPAEKSVGNEAGDYRIEVVPLGDGRLHMLKYRPDTGQAWWYSEDAAWIEIRDDDPVRRSHYIFEPSIDGSGWSVVRLDTRNGRTWITRNSIWVEVKDEPTSF